MRSSGEVEMWAGQAGSGDGRALGPRICRLITRWAGPRVIDGPMRLYFMLAGLAGLAVMGGLHPEVESLSLLCLAVGASGVATVTLSHMRVGVFLVLTGVLGLFQLLASVAVSGFPAGSEGVQAFQETSSEMFLAISLAWVLGGALGLTSAWIDARIRSFARQRACQHEYALTRMRLQLALDAHDAISHGLAVQAAIIRMIGAEIRQADRAHPRLTELALVNAHTQQQLRLLVGRLTRDSHPDAEEGDFAELLAAAADTVRSAAEAGGFELTLKLRALPSVVPGTFAEPVLAIMKELVTNIVKHASSPTDCSLELAHGVDDDGRSWLHFTSQNSAAAGACVRPESLSARAADLGGVCAVQRRAGQYVVVVSVPIPGSEDSLPRTSDVRSGRDVVSW